MNIHGVSAFRFFTSRILWATRCSTIFAIKTPSGHRLRFYPSSVSVAMWCNPRYFQNDEDVLRKYLRAGDVFVDVGANVGVLSLTASGIVGETGRVISVEAHPKTVEYLRGNVKLNGANNVTVIHAAAGDHEGAVRFSNARSDDQNRVTESGIEVPLRTLDSLVPETSIRFLKIDIEGFELFAIRGATRLLQRTEMIYFESFESHFNKYGYSTTDVLAFLKGHGFETGRPDGYKSLHCENLLAMRSKPA